MRKSDNPSDLPFRLWQVRHAPRAAQRPARPPTVSGKTVMVDVVAALTAAMDPSRTLYVLARHAQEAMNTARYVLADPDKSPRVITDVVQTGQHVDAFWCPTHIPDGNTPIDLRATPPDPQPNDGDK